MANSGGPNHNHHESPVASTIMHLRVFTDDSLIPRFLKLLERGFTAKIEAGLSIRELLCCHFGISEDYLDNRIQTIFLDGKPVDNINTALLQNGSKLALSAAMPGLVGAVFRKGGFYASLRETISYKKTENHTNKEAGEIIVKLFNLVAKELGPTLLEKGIQIDGDAFYSFVLRNEADLNNAGTSFHKNAKTIDISEILKINWQDKKVFIQVTPGQSA